MIDVSAPLARSRLPAVSVQQQRQACLLRHLLLRPVLSSLCLPCSRFDSNSGAGPNSAEAELDSPTAASIIESQLVRREGSMHLPRPADCNVQGTHSDMCIVRVRRNHLLEDALDEIARQYR